MTIIESNVAVVELPDVEPIHVRRVLRAEGWTVRFDVGAEHGINRTFMVDYLEARGYRRARAWIIVDSIRKLVWNHEPTV